MPCNPIDIESTGGNLTITHANSICKRQMLTFNFTTNVEGQVAEIEQINLHTGNPESAFDPSYLGSPGPTFSIVANQAAGGGKYKGSVAGHLRKQEMWDVQVYKYSVTTDTDTVDPVIIIVPRFHGLYAVWAFIITSVISIGATIAVAIQLDYMKLP